MQQLAGIAQDCKVSHPTNLDWCAHLSSGAPSESISSLHFLLFLPPDASSAAFAVMVCLRSVPKAASTSRRTLSSLSLKRLIKIGAAVL